MRNLYFTKSILIYLLAFFTLPVFGQLFQQGPRLYGTGTSNESYQGYSAAVSGDGNTAIVGGVLDDYSIGAAWIYTRTNGTWSQQGQKLVGTGYIDVPSQGVSVAISTDGNTAIVGGYSDNNYTGAAWIFVNVAGTWVQQSKLVGTGAIGESQQGVSVSLSADGNTAILGGYTDNNYAGAAWIFSRTGNTWIQDAKISGSDAIGNAQQGFSVSLAADGNTALIGGYDDNFGTGAAWVFKKTSGTWIQQGSKLVGTGASGAAAQGYSVSISGDGNTAVIGGYGDDNYVGATWLFSRTNNTWSQQGQKLIGSGSIGTPQQGQSVSISTDGNSVMIGGPGDSDYTGASWIFRKTVNGWIQDGFKLTGFDANGQGLQGFSVSLSADGRTAIAGGPVDANSAGASWIFSATPVITSFTPTSASEGNVVTITGINLTNTTSVIFGGIPALSFTVINATTVTATVSNGTSGSISLQTDIGIATKAGFTYSGCEFNMDTIMGPKNGCAYTGPSGLLAQYSIIITEGGNIHWNIPSGSTNISGQGTNHISFRFPTGFTSGDISVSAQGECGSAMIRTLSVTNAIPAAPSAIFGPGNPCIYIGSGIPVTYYVNPVPGAITYRWTFPSTITLLSASQDSSRVEILFNEGFNTNTNKNLKVKCISGCGNSKDYIRSLSVTKPYTPGSIMGPNNACIYMNTQEVATYTIRRTANTSSYIWTMPVGATIISHLGGTGENDTSVTVKFDESLQSVDTIRVQATSPCGISKPKKFVIKRIAPVRPATISGPANICPFMQSESNPAPEPVIYKVKKAAHATGYIWSVPEGASIVAHLGGEGINDTAISVYYFSNFVSGYIKVASKNGCTTSIEKTMAVTRRLAAKPGVINGPANICQINGAYTTYSIRRANYATHYTWIAPVGATILSHPGGEGSSTDTIVNVAFDGSFQGGVLSVNSLNNCSESSPRSLTIYKKLPSPVGTISVTQISATCPYRVYTYSVASMPANATTLQWTVPFAATLLSGQGTTTITVRYRRITIDTVKVMGVNNCGNGSLRKLIVNIPVCETGLGTGGSEKPILATNPDLNLPSQEVGIQVSPNPSYDQFVIKTGAGLESKSGILRVVDPRGRVIEERKVMNSSQPVTLGSNYPAGLYFIEYTDGKKKMFVRVIKL